VKLGSGGPEMVAYAHAVVDFADDTRTELERKADALKWVSLVETLAYVALAAFWLTGNKTGTTVFGALHGLIFLAFAAMVVMITRAMQWTLLFAAIALVTGPLGSLLVYERIRRHGVPQQARRLNASAAPSAA
jgi:hypothetical protein